ncbi:MAG: hypothetical protein Q9214_000421 [Letrouitia sp. 1 TL-2023]
MSSPPPINQKQSRWGLFLAGVESRLDTILADEDPRSTNPKATLVSRDHVERKDAASNLLSGNAKAEGISRSPSTSSTNRTQDRLNEKLAKAMANRNLNRMNEKSPTTSNLTSRTASPANGLASQRSSTEIKREGVQIDQRRIGCEAGFQEGIADNGPSEEILKVQELETSLDTSVVEDANQQRSSMDSKRSTPARQSLDLPRLTPDAMDLPETNGVDSGHDTKTPAQYEENILQMKSDYEAAELRRQEETHLYLERIDALQSKLQYLTREAADVAKRSISEATPGSLDEKLAIRDEKISLLMEEGHKLSQTELKHMSIIKKLRAKAAEDEKRLADTKRISEKHENAAREARERAKRAEDLEQRATEKNKSLLKLEKELENTTKDVNSKDILILDLQAQLADVTSAARIAEEKVQVEALEAEKKRTADLLDELSYIKAGKELAEKQHQTEMREAKEKAEREKERARVAEIERQGEQNILESRLEAFRARAEEASAASSEDIQAKLLRQIETLQNQYAVASENWQGIEGSLLTRVTALEKERDDISRREAEIRRKARESNLKSRRAEEELQQALAKTEDTGYKLMQQKSQVQLLQERALKAEADTTAIRKELNAEREALDAKRAQRLEHEKPRPREDASRTPDTLYQQFRAESPINYAGNRKGSNADKTGSHSRRYQGLAITGMGHPSQERSLSRHSSSQPLGNSEPRPPSRQDSVGQPSASGGIPETPSIQIGNEDDFFDGVKTPATPERTINDMISVSTAAAGPSVQLVERMSAAVRRLESEKEASKDELARLSSQRDEAREQVVGLMREVEEKRSADERVKQLEKEVAEINARYLTTLEMLGEKSEKVEELKADVADVKQMYRELVDSTMR